MTTPSSIIRPATLNASESSSAPTPPIPGLARPSTSNDEGARNVENLERMISGIVDRIVRTECRSIFHTLINPNADQFSGTDQSIDPRYENNLSELDKVPDVVRCLKDFSGIPGEFNSWKKSVDRILRLYENYKGTPKYFGILSVVRNKIIGQADVVLESYNTPLDWKCIARCLTMHYADKRDLSTLEYQMTSLVQGNQTIQEFYHSVYSHLSLILNKIGCMDVTNESITLLTQTYRDKALDTFIRGLRGDLPRLLGIREPADLPQALHLCLKLENQNYRTQYANSHHGPSRVHNQVVPPLPPKRNINSRPNPQQNQALFYPELAHLPQPRFNPHRQPFQHPRQYNPQGQTNYFNPQPWQNQRHYNPQGQINYSIPPRPSASKPQPRPEPMDVDQSLQTRNINYMNRPAQNALYGKRPPTGVQTPAPPNKYQRNFHIEAQENTSGNSEQPYLSQEEIYEQTLHLPDEDYNQSLADYLESSQESEIPEQNPIDPTDIHFLD